MAAANPPRASLSIAATLVQQFPPADVEKKCRVIWSMGWGEASQAQCYNLGQ